MEPNNIKQKLSNDKGITLVALIITVIVLMVIASVSINTGTEALDSTRLQGFYTELEIIQRRVDDIQTTNESHLVDEDGDKKYDITYIINQGESVTDVDALQAIINEELDIELDASTFKYYSADEVEQLFDLSDIHFNVFIHFNTRTVIAEEGIEINGTVYHALKNNIYYSEHDTTKNEGTLELTYNIAKYGANNYKITVTPTTVGDLIANGTLKYKKTRTKYWETSENLEMIIDELTQYNIEYKDNNNNTVTELIVVALDEDENPTVTVVE